MFHLDITEFKKKKDNYKSYQSKKVGDNIVVLKNTIRLPKLGEVKAAISKKVEGRILNATVSLHPSGKYYISICCTDVEIEQYESTGKMVGLDVGISNLITTSDGKTYENHKYLEQTEEKLIK